MTATPKDFQEVVNALWEIHPDFPENLLVYYLTQYGMAQMVEFIDHFRHRFLEDQAKLEPGKTAYMLSCFRRPEFFGFRFREGKWVRPNPQPAEVNTLLTQAEK